MIFRDEQCRLQEVIQPVVTSALLAFIEISFAKKRNYKLFADIIS